MEQVVTIRDRYHHIPLRQARYRERQRVAGKCIQCGKARAKHPSLCPECAQKKREANRVWREAHAGVAGNGPISSFDPPPA
jgi:uncharacterized OB-fold protein